MSRSRKTLCLIALMSTALAACGRPRGGTDAGTDGGVVPDAGTLCGNGVLDTGETCDDGNTRFGDGCGATCQTEPGWSCSAGGICSESPACGDGFIENTEECDDGNTVGGTLPPVGGVHLTDGGTAGLDGGVVETDGGVDVGDGCTKDCKLVPGWVCPDEGRPCHAAQCGDGIVVGAEQCDDGNSVNHDGCDSDCRLETNFYCPTPGAPCQPTHCGDHVAQGTEQCDDGNNDIGDGCSPDCQWEPQCDTSGVCTPRCGDGVILPNDTTEQCDDGNNVPGDGCSASCTTERDFSCTFTTDVPPPSLNLLVVYRDLRRHDSSPNPGHIDFNNVNHAETGILGPLYSPLVNNKPHYALGDPAPSGSTTHGSVPFFAWYNDVPYSASNTQTQNESANKTVVSTLTLPRQGDGSYVFDNQFFFPVDGLGWDALSSSDPLYEPQQTANDGHLHNFSFTSEVRYWFQYKGDEVLTFRGDDDVWVFINTKLALDLGGVHGAQNGTVTLSSVQSQLGLTVGGIYEVVVLQAERHVNASSYRLTLNNFEAKRTVCRNLCGDGTVQADQGEECDDGNSVSGDGCSSTCISEVN